MLSATANGGGAETLYYDGIGHRVQKTIAGTGGSTTNYFYDAFGRLAAESVNGVWSRDCIRDGAGNLIATENVSGPCTTCYFAYDHLGSVRLMMDQNASVVGRHDYLPFGEDVSGNAGRTGPGFHLPGTVAMDAAQQFTGQVRDQEAGQDYFNVRYFTPALGRFNSVDPRNAGADFTSSQSWNGYGYVLGNPLNGVDPSGARWVTFQVQVCTPSISSTIVYYTLPSGSSNGTTSACHSVPMEIWVDDNPPVIGISGGSGPGGAGPGGGSGGGGSATQGPSKTATQPKLPPCNDANYNRSRFFQQLPAINALAQRYNVPASYLTGLASYESGWLDNHNYALKNLWGLTKAGGNNLSFPSFQAGNAYFAARVGPFIQNSQTMAAFFKGLQKEGYNAVNPNYYRDLASRINSIPKWEAACQVQ